MGANTKIEWADFTLNPWIGCTRVSAACDHCYAEALAHRYGWAEWGNHPRHRTSASTWKQPLKWNRDAAASGTRGRVFCASLADVFDNQAPEEWRDELWDLIEQCESLDWLLLTKRPQNILKMLPKRYIARRWTDRGSRLTWPWPNVWLGTTVENQAEADRRIPHLLSVPAKVHFLSCEPLLGSLNLTRWIGKVRDDGTCDRPFNNQVRHQSDQNRDDICGATNLPHSYGLPSTPPHSGVIPSDVTADHSPDPLDYVGVSVVNRQTAAASPIIAPTPIDISLPVEHPGNVAKHGTVGGDSNGSREIISAGRLQSEAGSNQFSGDSGAARADRTPNFTDAPSSMIGGDDLSAPFLSSLKHGMPPRLLREHTIAWVIVGGESGPHARPMHPDWARSLRDQCAAAGVAFFMKQMSGFKPEKELSRFPELLRVREFPHAA
ncbi:MAG TPA: DUF5131 family protein [Terriglobales bacterium]